MHLSKPSNPRLQKKEAQRGQHTCPRPHSCGCELGSEPRFFLLTLNLKGLGSMGILEPVFNSLKKHSSY